MFLIVCTSKKKIIYIYKFHLFCFHEFHQYTRTCCFKFFLSALYLFSFWRTRHSFFLFFFYILFRFCCAQYHCVRPNHGHYHCSNASTIRRIANKTKKKCINYNLLNLKLDYFSSYYTFFFILFFSLFMAIPSLFFLLK